jgi:zinc and cadmium transporter
MSLLLIAVSLAILGSVGGIVLGAVLLVFRESLRTKLVPWLVSYAVGTLLGVALLDVLPEALVSLKPTPVFGALLGGILAFFILEKLVLWHHCHDDHCAALIGHSVHNLIDGAVIAAATYVSIPLGVTSALAVAAHEIPQQVGDFAILLHAGYSRTKALWLNVLSGMSAAGGVLLAYLAIDRLPHILPYFLPVAAASFLYIAMSDLIPSLHRSPLDGGAVRQVLLVGAGILTITLL